MIPDEAVEVAAKHLAFYVDRPGTDWTVEARALLQAAAPHMLAAKVSEVRGNNDHIVEGGDGYSAGFHYALHCISPDA